MRRLESLHLSLSDAVKEKLATELELDNVKKLVKEMQKKLRSSDLGKEKKSSVASSSSAEPAATFRKRKRKPVTMNDTEGSTVPLKASRKPRKDNMSKTEPENEEYVVDMLLAHSGNPLKRDSLKFLVRWKNYGPEFDTWEPYETCVNLAAMDIYQAAHPELDL